MIRQKPFVPLLLAALVAAALWGVLPAWAQGPTLPHAFLGTVEIAGQPAPVDTQVEGRGTNVVTGIPYNPLITTKAGEYGGPGGFDPKLLVQGPEIPDGTPLQFYVNGMLAECAEPGGAWSDSFAYTAGVVTILNLRVQEAAPALPTLTPTPTSTPTATRSNVTAQPTSQTPVAAVVSTATPSGGGATATAPVATAGAATQSAPATSLPTAAAGGAATAVTVSTPTSQPGAQANTTPTAAALAQAPSPTPPPSPTSAEAKPTATLPVPSPTPIPSPTRAPTAVVTRATGQPILGTSQPSGSGSAQPTPTAPAEQGAASSPWLLAVLVVVVVALVAGGVAFYLRRSKKGDQ